MENGKERRQDGRGTCRKDPESVKGEKGICQKRQGRCKRRKILPCSESGIISPE